MNDTERQLAALSDPAALADAIAALRNAGQPVAGSAAAVLPYARHGDAAVRLVVAQALPWLDEVTDDVVAALIALTTDPEDDVRDWATFGLGRQITDLDRPDQRDALAARLDDPHDDTRCEALLGLAYLRDPRALPAVIAALQRDDIFILEVEAAGALGNPELHALLDGHVEGWDHPAHAVIAREAWRLTDPAGPGRGLGPAESGEIS